MSLLSVLKPILLISILNMEWPAMVAAFVLGLIFILYRDYRRKHKKP